LEEDNRRPVTFRDKCPRRPNTGKNAWARAKAGIRRPPVRDVEYGSDFASTVTDRGGDEEGAKHKLTPYERDDQLAGWDGEWSPAPIDWDNRPQVVEKHWNLRTDDWWQRLPTPQAWETVPLAILTSTDNEVAPMSWARTEMGEKPFSLWWREHTREPEVEPDAEPWFHLYECDLVLQPLSHPISNVTASDSKKVSQAATAAERMEQWEKSALKRHLEAQTRRRVKSPPPETFVPYVAPPNIHAPKVDIYLRAATITDLKQIMAIYNAFATDTVFVSDCQPLSMDLIRSRYTDVTENGLPWIVAVDKSQRLVGPKGGKTAKLSPREEHIVGFAFAEDHDDIKNMYRYTAEMEVYVRQGWERNGIAKCLVDRMMVTMDSNHLGRGGYDFGLNGKDQYMTGDSRVVKSILVNVHFDMEDAARLAWLQTWLEEEWEFKRVGLLEGLGYKLGKMISRAIFLRRTGCTVLPSIQA